MTTLLVLTGFGAAIIGGVFFDPAILAVARIIVAFLPWRGPRSIAAFCAGLRRCGRLPRRHRKPPCAAGFGILSDGSSRARALQIWAFPLEFAMTTTRKTHSRARKVTELGIAVPQVVGHRLARLAAAGPSPSARDRREFQRMGAEKFTAFSQSWLAVSMAMWQANLALGASMLRTMGMPGLQHSPAQLGWQWQSAMTGALDKGIAPIHRTATANARRLARVR